MNASQIPQIKEAINIVQVIGERMTLQRSGNSWRGLCPFHGEKSPSFFVNEQFQRYKCFGCGESGDVFTFLEKYEGMTFGEAMKYLAAQAGIELLSYTPTPQDNERERLLEVLSLTKEYYHYILTKHRTGEAARQYLKSRGITQESIRLFQLGYALPSWDGLINFLHVKKKLSLADIQAAGLIIQGKQNRHYDRFRDRLMFPLTNHRGQVVGFSGRVLDSTVKEAKYINTPETMLYHKSQMLFGYSELYQEIRKKKEVIVVEGEFDVISSAQAHVNHVVAVKGSAVTKDHLRLLQRVADKIIFALDADSAGVQATKRAIALAQDATVDLRVLVVPQGKDPDELARSQPQLWRQASKQTLSIYEFLLQATLKTYDVSTPEGKRQVMLEYGPILATITLSVEQDVYIKKLAVALNVKEDLIKTDLKRVQHKKQLGSGNGKYENRPTNATPQPGVEPAVIHTNTSISPKRAGLEAYLFFLLLRSPSQLVPERAQQLAEQTQLSASYLPLIHKIIAQGADFELQHWAASLSETDQAQVMTDYLSPTFVANWEKVDEAKEWAQKLKELQLIGINEEIDEITSELNRLDAQHHKTTEQEQRQNALLEQIVRLQRELKVVR